MEVRNLGGAPSSREFPCSRGYKKGFPVPLRASGELSADGAPPFVRAIGYPRPSAHSDSFATPMAKESRTQVVGSVREAPGGLPCVAFLLVLFFRHGKKSTQSHLPDKLQFTGNPAASAAGLVNMFRVQTHPDAPRRSRGRAARWKARSTSSPTQGSRPGRRCGHPSWPAGRENGWK